MRHIMTLDIDTIDAVSTGRHEAWIMVNGEPVTWPYWAGTLTDYDAHALALIMQEMRDDGYRRASIWWDDGSVDVIPILVSV